MRAPRKRFKPEYLYSSARYERKLVGFYDFLGWRKKIDWAENDEERLGLLAKLLRMNAMMESVSSTKSFPQQFTSFSDNVVMSIKPEVRSLEEVLFRLGCGQFAAATLGFYMRGAVTIGSIIHDDFVVFGPALNRAYELESEIAIYPRIILDPACIETFGPLPTFVACENGIHFIDTFTETFAEKIQRMAEAGIHHPSLAKLGAPLPSRERFMGNAHERLVSVLLKLRQELETAPNEAATVKLAWIFKRMASSAGVDTKDFWHESTT